MKNLLFITLFLLTTFVLADKLIPEPVTIGERTLPDASAVLDVKSTTKGLLPPRMTETQRDAVSSPANGLIIFNTTAAALEIHSGGVWASAGGGGVSAWVTATDYVIGNIVHEDNKFYIALTNHTSSVFMTEYAADDWQEMSPSFTGWITAQYYEVGHYVVESEHMYECLVAHTSGTFATDLAANDWKEIALPHGTISIDATQLNTSFSTPSHSEGLMYYDQNFKAVAVHTDSANVISHLGQKMMVKVTNTGASTINKGEVVYLSGFDTIPEAEKAISTSESFASKVIGLAAENITASNDGYVLYSGVVDSIDTTGPGAETWLQGDILYVSETAGVLTNVHPASPLWDTHVGFVVNAHATQGMIGIRIVVGNNDKDTFNFFNSTFLQKNVSTFKDDPDNPGSEVIFTIEKDGGGDLDIYFNGEFTNFPTTAAASCDDADNNCARLTLGTATVPVLNYIYILESTNALTIADSWPAGVHAPISTVYAQDYAGVLADGPYKEHEWVNYLAATGKGHLNHINKWIRNQHATYLSGVAPTFTGSGTGSITAEFTAGQVLQLHEHTFGEQSSPATMWLTNYCPSDPCPDTPNEYKEISNINEITTDALGGTIDGKTIGLVFWGSVNKVTGESKIFINLPSGSYLKNQADQVREDLGKFQNFSVPAEFRGTGFLIHRMVVDLFGGNYTIYDGVGAGDNLRGQLPGTSTGGSIGAGTEFPASLFRIFDPTDATKELAFDVSGVSTSTLRTLTMPDGSGTLILAEGLSGGQSLNGGTDASDDLTFDSTSNGTKGDILFPNSNVGIGGAPDASTILDVVSTTKGSRPCPPMTSAQIVTLTSVPPANGSCVYDTDLLKYFYFDGTAWLNMGSGGAGSLDVFLAEDFETTVAADFSKDSDATFLGTSGTFDGTLSDETGSPIAGLSSIKWVGHATAGNNDDDWIALPAITLDSKQQGKDVGVSFYYEWDGADDNMVFRAYCSAPSSVKLSSDLDQLKTQADNIEYTTSIFVPLTCTELTIGFHVITGEVSKTLLIDDIQLSTDPFVYKNLIEEQTLNFSANASTMTAAGSGTLRFGTVSSVGTDLLEYDDSTGFFTALRELRIESAHISWRATGTVNTYIDTSSGSVIYANATNVAGRHQTTSATINMDAGDAIRFRTDGAYDSARLISMNIRAQATTEYVITPAKSRPNNHGARIENNGTASIISQGGRNQNGEYAIASTNRSSAGLGTVTYTSNFFSVTPKVTATTANAADSIDITIYNETTSGFSFVTYDETGAVQDFNFNLDISRQEEDYIENFGITATPVQRSVTLESGGVNNISATSSTGYTAMDIDNYTITGDEGVASITSNQLILGAGDYLIRINASLYGNVSTGTFGLYNDTDSAYEGPEDSFGYNVSTNSLVNTSIYRRVTITSAKVFEFHMKTSNAAVGSGMRLQDTEILKLR